MLKQIKTLMFLTIAYVFIFMIAAVVSAQETGKVKFEAGDSVEVMRDKIIRNGYNFTVDHNWVYDMSSEQKAQFFKRRPPIFPRTEAIDAGPLEDILKKRAALPPTFDTRNIDGASYIGPVRNQGNCGSCYSFAAAAAAEGTYNKINNLFGNNVMNFSEAFIAFCLSKMPEYMDHFNGCNGADYDYYELEALTKVGIINDADLPYTAKDPNTCSAGNIPFEPSVKFASWHRIPCNDINAIKTAIMNYGVVDTAVLVNDPFMAYKSGVYYDDNTTCNTNPCYYTDTNHAITLVGWDDTAEAGNGEKGCWILRNSWGESWGESGYMRISYNAAHITCGATYLVYDVKTPTATTEPATEITQHQAILNGKVNPHGSDTNCYFEIGIANSNQYTQKVPSPGISVGSGTNNVSKALTITGLIPNTGYIYRIVATNSFGTTYGSQQTLYTPSDIPLKPTVLTGSAASVTPTSAVLNGIVNPHNADTTYYFEYGTDTKYGSVTTINSTPLSGVSDVPVSASLFKLNPITTYHYRIMAKNINGSADPGLDQTFITQNNTATNALMDNSFESGSPNPYWEDKSQLLIRNIYQAPEVAHTGDWLIWFAGGGVPDPTHSGAPSGYGGAENATVSQNFVIPSVKKATLKFFWRPYCPCGTPGTFTVKLDDFEIFKTDQAIDNTSYPWKEFTKDVTAYADGKSHQLTFNVVITYDPNLKQSTDFMVDDISLVIENPASLDVNGDGSINLGDVIYLLQIFAGVRDSGTKTLTEPVFTEPSSVQVRISSPGESSMRFFK